MSSIPLSRCPSTKRFVFLRVTYFFVDLPSGLSEKTEKAFLVRTSLRFWKRQKRQKNKKMTRTIILVPSFLRGAYKVGDSLIMTPYEFYIIINADIS